MRGRSARRFLKRVGVVLACLVVSLGLCRALYAAANYWRVEHVIGRFEAGPSQANADALVKTMASRMPTARQGERILRLLLTPRVTVQDVYPAGEDPGIDLEPSFKVRFEHMTMARDAKFLCDGKPMRAVQTPKGSLITGIPASRVLFPTLSEAGTYRVEMQQTYVFSVHKREDAWSWHPLSRPFPRGLLPYRDPARTRFGSGGGWHHRCTIVVEIGIVVAERSEAGVSDLVRVGVGRDDAR
jgi:hypothetical protein